eukprot:1963380-Rhodomonas_salina.1
MSCEMALPGYPGTLVPGYLGPVPEYPDSLWTNSNSNTSSNSFTPLHSTPGTLLPVLARNAPCSLLCPQVPQPSPSLPKFHFWFQNYP